MVSHTVPRYWILQCVGRWGGGAVFVAEKTQLGHLAAPGAIMGAGAAGARRRCSRGRAKSCINNPLFGLSTIL